MPTLAHALACAQGAPPDAVKELAPTGKLRAAINYGNGVLAQKGADGPQGISADLSRELAKRLGVPLEFVTFEAAGKVFEAIKAGGIDVAFIAIEPVRAAEIEFTAPYVLIEGTYMVPADSALKAIADVDRPGVRIAVGSFFALREFLRVPLGPMATFAFVSHKLLRWVLPFLMIGMLVSNIVLFNAEPLYRVLLAAQAVFYGWAAAGFLFQGRMMRVRFGLLGYFLVSIHLAYLVGFIRFRRRRGRHGRSRDGGSSRSAGPVRARPWSSG